MLKNRRYSVRFLFKVSKIQNKIQKDNIKQGINTKCPQITKKRESGTLSLPLSLSSSVLHVLSEKCELQPAVDLHFLIQIMVLGPAATVVFLSLLIMLFLQIFTICPAFSSDSLLAIHLYILWSFRITELNSLLCEYGKKCLHLVVCPLCK